MCSHLIEDPALMAGMQREEVPFEGGVVMLMSPNDPELIQQIHPYCDTINMELQAMSAAMEG